MLQELEAGGPWPGELPVTPVRVQAAASLAGWLLLGLVLGLLMWPYQALSELGFRLQMGLWLANQPQSLLGCVLVFAATSMLVLLAWGPLAAGRGGGTTSLLALDRAPQAERHAGEALWLQQLSLVTQMRRLPLMLLTVAARKDVTLWKRFMPPLPRLLGGLFAGLLMVH